MSAVRSRRSSASRVPWLVAGAIVLHQLRYALSYGEAVSVRLAEQEHGYLVVVAPVVVALLGVGVCWQLVLAPGRHMPRMPARVALLQWLSITTALLMP